MLFPGEPSAVHDRSTKRRAVPAHELCQGMHDDVRAVIDRLQKDRGCNGVVDDQRNAMLVRDARQLFDVADVARRVADAFAEHGPGVVVDQALDGVGTVGFCEARIDSLARQNVGEQSMCCAVKLRHRNDVGTESGDIQHRIIQCRLTGTDAQRLDAAFQCGNPPFQHRVGRIADPAVAKSVDFEVEQRRAVFGAVKRIGDGLIDRDRHGFGRRVDVISAMDGDRLVAHLCHLIASPRASLACLRRRAKRVQRDDREERR